MSTESPKSEQRSSNLPTPPDSTTSRAAPKPPRVLACLLCQRRKIKCNREFPCSNCIKASVPCVPATKTKRQQRRRRFPERELLDRLRRYESLLRQNDIKFEPLHAEKKTSYPNNKGSDSSDDEGLDAGAARSNNAAQHRSAAVSFWDAMNRSSRDVQEDDDEYDDDSCCDSYNDSVRESVVQKAWDEISCWHESDDLLLFSSHKAHGSLPTSELHPEQSQIFKLWQIYLDNVDPLLKVTHTPTLQARIIDAVSDIANIDPVLEALMFSIYSAAILSLEEDTCLTLFGLSKDHLLRNYRYACQQALVSCSFMLSDQRDCLTAFYLYLISVRPNVDPRALTCMVGVAIRLAQRLGIHNEPTGRHTAFETEMRRRLWWSLVIFDQRVCEMCDNKSATLGPTWDRQIPLNVNDFDLRPELKAPPTSYEKQPTEAVFVAVFCELGDFVRHSACHLDFTSPALKGLAKDTMQQGAYAQGGSAMDNIEKTLEDRYFAFFNPEIPLHTMTIWATKAWILKTRLLEHYSRFARSSTPQCDTDRDTAISYAIDILGYDTNMIVSPLTQKYFWFVRSSFPFPAYIHILQDMRKRPLGQHTERAWEVMSQNYEPRFKLVARDHGPLMQNHLFRVYSRLVLNAWDTREAALRQLGQSPTYTPRIVVAVRRETMPIEWGLQGLNVEQPNGAMGFQAPKSMPLDVGDVNGIPYDAGLQGYPDTTGQNSMNMDVEKLFSLDWASMDWNPMQDIQNL